MRLHRRSTAAAAVVVCTSLMSGPALATPPDNPDKLATAVRVDNTMTHLQALQQIAKDNDGNRMAGSPGHEASARYVESKLTAAGYKPQRQYFEFTYEEVNKSSLTQNSPSPQTIEQVPMRSSPGTPAEGVTADLVAPTVATGCNAEEWAGVDAKGKIALVSRGVCRFGEKSAAAGKAGAKAIIIYNNVDGPLNGSMAEAPGYVPTTGITKDAGTTLLEKMKQGPVNVTFVLDKLIEKRTTFNILAETAMGRPDKVTMVGAHLDGVPAGPGINDNGSGSAAILETAIQLGKARKIDKKIRFAFWGAEELGLIGSTHYVNDLVANNPAELKRISGYLNFDMVASPNYIIGVYDADGSTFKPSSPVPPGSVEIEALFTKYFDRTRQPWVDAEFSGRSDYGPFIANGVPAGGLFTGADGKKTAQEVTLFGGKEGEDYDPNYHTPKDDLSNVNRDALRINLKAIAYVTGQLAFDRLTVIRNPGQPKPTRVGPQAAPDTAVA